MYIFARAYVVRREVMFSHVSGCSQDGVPFGQDKRVPHYAPPPDRTGRAPLVQDIEISPTLPRCLPPPPRTGYAAGSSPLAVTWEDFLITARIRSMTGRYCFHRCLSVNISGGGGGYPVSVKGKIFDSRFGLIHVQTGKKNFCQGTLPPPQ